MQIVYSRRKGARQMEHLGSAHTDEEYELLLAAARQRLAAGQGELDLGLEEPGTGGPLPITATRMEHLIGAVRRIYADLGLEDAAGGDEVFWQLVLARLVEPTSKLDSLRVIEETGLAPASYATVKRRLPRYAAPDFRKALAAALAERAELGPAALILYDVSTLYFEADEGDGFREPGYSKERRIDPQITIGLLTDATGFPLMVNAFEGNKAETKTMLPVIEAFKATYALTDVTVVADAGMLSHDNRDAIEAAGLSYILGAKLPDIPYVVEQWMAAHPDTAPEDGQIFTAKTFTGPAGARREARIYYQYRSARARRTLRGIDAQVAKAEQAAAGKAPVKRNRFLTVTGEARAVNRDLEAKARALAGYKGYLTNLPPERASAEFVIGAYHRLWNIEKSFRMSKHDLAARPIYHRLQDSIDAHLTVVFAALAVARRLEHLTDWSLKRFITTARRYKTITIRAGDHDITAADPLPADLTQALTRIHAPDGTWH
ncbi:IS1634 family transposase [Georgenia thermotolerans]|uniref:IS1634 family transposase n=1 Tax=Georgenia thermotolerans TaxID=527326 RepID=A0A7J5UID0_9MICO|nr:IS1634 family transposase [Georgenia thermotolerans]KAE8762127.1 IS1634 family transposase [Georgenia thermotolerans]